MNNRFFREIIKKFFEWNSANNYCYVSIYIYTYMYN